MVYFKNIFRPYRSCTDCNFVIISSLNRICSVIIFNCELNIFFTADGNFIFIVINKVLTVNIDIISNNCNFFGIRVVITLNSAVDNRHNTLSSVGVNSCCRIDIKSLQFNLFRCNGIIRSVIILRSIRNRTEVINC